MFWTQLSRICPALAAVMCAAALGACQNNTIPSGSYYMISAAKAPFYKFGPAQESGPDFSLNEGTKIIMLEHSFGYSRVMTADGTAGWVSTDDVRPAPPGTFTTSNTVKNNYSLQMNRPIFDGAKPAPKQSNVPGNSSPLFDPGDNPLTPKSTPTPAPSFHY